jgi:hypothetical protein
LIAIYRKTIISNFLNPSEKTAENMEHFMTHADLENLYRLEEKGEKKEENCVHLKSWSHISEEQR